MKEERRIIVDENDEIIGSKLKSEMRFPDDIYRVSGLWLTNPVGEVLLARRGLALSNGSGLWGPAAAGTVEVGETYESNMIKEIAEELGVSDLAVRAFEKVFIYERENQRRFFCQWFKSVTDKDLGDFRPNAREVAELRWWPQSELERALENEPEEFINRAAEYWKRLIEV